jgi:hypothetical protein
MKQSIILGNIITIDEKRPFAKAKTTMVMWKVNT